MTQLLKRLVTFGLILLLLGGIIFVIAFAASGFNYEKMLGIKVSYETFEESDALTAKKLVLNFDNTDVNITFDENAERIKVSYPLRTSKSNNKLNTVTAIESGDVITIKEETNWKSNLFIWGSGDYNVSVTLPAGRGIELYVECDNGDVNFAGDGLVGSVTVSTDNGDISSDRASIKSLQNMKFSSDNGEIELGKIDTVSLYLETDNGDIDMNECFASEKINISTDNGDVNFDGNVTSLTLEIETDNGEIESDKSVIDAKSIKIETDNGDIKIVLFGKSGDYEIKIRQQTGSSNVSNQIGPDRKLDVETSNGDIKVLFTE